MLEALAIVVGLGLVSGALMWVARSFGDWAAATRDVNTTLKSIEMLMLRMARDDAASHAARFVADIPSDQEKAS